MTYRKIKGRVYQRSDSNVPLEGVLVRAYSQTSGLLSSNSISDRLGSYEVLLPDTQDTSFRVIAEWPDSTQPAWRFEQNIRVERGEDRQLDIGFTQTMPDQQGHAQIRFLGDGDRGPEPITKANVTLTASAAFDTQTYKLVAMTDDDGYVVIPKTTGNERPNLVAATYEIEIIPPSGSIFARSKQALDLNRVGPSNTADKHIALAKRVYVSGAVASARGELVAGANIVVTYQTKSSELPSPGVVINTKADGSFNAWLDPGDYLFRVTPPPEDSRSNTESPKAFQLITIPSDVPGHMLAPFYLSEGSVIQGEVVGAANEIIGNGSVETFIQLEDLDTPVSLGIQSLDRFGRFEAFVPSK